jgi:hypothetical protein
MDTIADRSAVDIMATDMLGVDLMVADTLGMDTLDTDMLVTDTLGADMKDVALQDVARLPGSTVRHAVARFMAEADSMVAADPAAGTAKNNLGV